MFAVQLNCRMDGGRDFGVHVHGGQWVGDECVFEFSVRDYQLAGLIRCDWREKAPRFDLSDGTPNSDEQVRVLGGISDWLRGFHTEGHKGLSDEALEALYGQDYHQSENYSAGLERERTRKRRMAELVVSCVAPRKVLVAGCSAGETVRQLRQLGVDAWGFDICPDLDAIAYPEVRDFVRRGSLTDIPFDAADGFDTLTAFDLLEHVPEDRVAAAVESCERLGVRNIVALIAHCEFQIRGHVTLRPLSWWEAQFAPHFQRARSESLDSSWPSVDASASPDSLLRVFQRT